MGRGGGGVDQITSILTAIGLPPAAAGIGVVLAILLRYLRGMIASFSSEASYVTALAFGALGALLSTSGNDWKPIVQIGLELTAFVLILQKVLEKAAESVPWLPQDNEWVKK